MPTVRPRTEQWIAELGTAVETEKAPARGAAKGIQLVPNTTGEIVRQILANNILLLDKSPLPLDPQRGAAERLAFLAVMFELRRKIGVNSRPSVGLDIGGSFTTAR